MRNKRDAKKNRKQLLAEMDVKQGPVIDWEEIMTSSGCRIDYSTVNDLILAIAHETCRHYDVLSTMHPKPSGPCNVASTLEVGIGFPKWLAQLLAETKIVATLREQDDPPKSLTEHEWFLLLKAVYPDADETDPWMT